MLSRCRANSRKLLVGLRLGRNATAPTYTSSRSPRHQDHFWILNGHQHPCSLFSKADAHRRRTARIEDAAPEMEQLPAHHSLARPDHPSVLHRQVDLLIHRGPENIATPKTFRFAAGERNLRICVSISERLQKIEDGTACLAARFGMRQEADTVWPPNALHPGLRGKEGFDYVQMSQLVEEKRDGRAPLEIRYSAMGRLPMCEAAPSAVSQSPNPQSQAARDSDGRASTSSLTRFRS
jgi:hypothetical protein